MRPIRTYLRGPRRPGVAPLLTERVEETLGALLPGLMYSVVLPYLGSEAAAEEFEIASPAPAC